MEQRGLPFSRIKAVRGGDPQGLTAESHRERFLLAHTEPNYPAEAIARRIEGEVLLDAVISREGKVLELSARSGDPLLAQAAMETVRTWNYRPTKVNGIPVEVATDIRVIFQLPDSVVTS